VWPPQTSLTPLLFIELPVPSQESEHVMYLCLRDINFALFYDFDI
jgi:hypothetical protein